MSGAGTSSLERLPVAFATALREAGMEVPTGAVVTFARALERLGALDRAALYWAGLACLTCTAEDATLYHQVFHWFFLGELVAQEPPRARQVPRMLVTDGGEEAGVGAGGASAEITPVRYSAVERLGSKDFAACTPEEIAQLRHAVHQLEVLAPLKRDRRRHRRRARARRLDLRRTVRASLSTGGEPIRRHYIAPGNRRRRLVLLLDVSGSMEPYARMLAQFAHGAVAGSVRAEVFTIGTRCTRVTQELSGHDPDAALARAAGAVADWSGGTRLGEGLREFNTSFGVRGMARGAVVVVLSDGWDRGDPSLLDEQMARLARVAWRVIWVNPLKASPGYAPLARGMSAALPYVDVFVEGHSLSSLERLASLIQSPGRPCASGRGPTTGPPLAGAARSAATGAGPADRLLPAPPAPAGWLPGRDQGPERLDEGGRGCAR